MTAILAIYYFGLTGLMVTALHRLWMTWIYQKQVKLNTPPMPAPPNAWPSVTIQVPIYNERFVVSRILRALLNIDYDPTLLDIQILDDSDDDTSHIIADVLNSALPHRFPIHHISRKNRSGYKAGALANGLGSAKGEMVAIFDADFVPPSDFLRRTLPYFSEPNVAVVQARWGFLNVRESMLTTAQALMLDSHFLVEQSVRAHRGRFLNFNGTAGVWRRSAILSAGGWRAETLTEDLDLSFRAQLDGWKIVFLPDYAVPSELPADWATFRAQQFRWAKGSAQTFRLLFKALLRKKLPLETRIDALIHLANHHAYLALLCVLAAFPWVMAGRGPLNPWNWFDTVICAISSISMFGFFLSPKRRISGSTFQWAKGLVGTAVFGIGIALNNAVASINGLIRRQGVFIRTPKNGAARKQQIYRVSSTWIEAGEFLFSLYLWGSLLFVFHQGLWMPIPFFLCAICAATWPAFAGIHKFVARKLNDFRASPNEWPGTDENLGLPRVASQHHSPATELQSARQI